MSGLVVAAVVAEVVDVDASVPPEIVGDFCATLSVWANQVFKVFQISFKEITENNKNNNNNITIYSMLE